MELGDVTARECRGQERHARQPLGEPHPGASDRPGDAGVVGEPGLGAHGAIRDEAAPPLHLRDGSPVAGERGRLATRQHALSVGIDSTAQVQLSECPSPSSSPAVPGPAGTAVPGTVSVRTPAWWPTVPPIIIVTSSQRESPRRVGPLPGATAARPGGPAPSPPPRSRSTSSTAASSDVELVLQLVEGVPRDRPARTR